MNIAHESHQLHYFVNNSDIEAIPQLVSALRERFKDLNLAPTFGQEFNPISGKKRDILVLSSVDKTLSIEFPRNEILVIKEGGNQKEFKELTIRLLTGIGEFFPFKRGNRISVINSKFYTGSEDEYNSVYNNLFTYTKATPFEWDNRIAERKNLEKSKEEINSISTIRRLEYQHKFIDKGEIKDIIIFEIDSNTIYQNTSNRFGLIDSLEVYDELYANNELLSTELKRYF